MSNNYDQEFLELVHSYNHGLVGVVSIGGPHFFITLIHDFSLKSWVYFIRKESDALEVHKIFISFVASQSKKKENVLRRNNSHEYASNKI